MDLYECCICTVPGNFLTTLIQKLFFFQHNSHPFLCLVLRSQLKPVAGARRGVYTGLDYCFIGGKFRHNPQTCCQHVYWLYDYMTMMMTKEEEQNRFKMHIYYHFCWLEDFLKHNGGVPDEIQRNWEIVRKSLRNTIYFLSLLFWLGAKYIWRKSVGEFGICGQSFLQRRGQDRKTTNGVGGNSLLRTIDWGRIRSKWTNLAAGWFLSPANQSQSSSLKKSRWKKTLPAKTHL